MGEKIELIFGYAEHTPGQIAVRFKLDGQEFKSLRDAGTAEGSHAALVLGTNARNSGFYWTERKVDPSDGVKTPVNLFMTDHRRGTYPEQARQLPRPRLRCHSDWWLSRRGGEDVRRDHGHGRR